MSIYSKTLERTCSKSANNSGDTTIRHPVTSEPLFATTIVPHSSRSTIPNGRRLPHHTQSSTKLSQLHCPIRIHQLGHPLHINDPSLNQHKHGFKTRVPITRSAAQDKAVERCGLTYYIRHWLRIHWVEPVWEVEHNWSVNNSASRTRDYAPPTPHLIGWPIYNDVKARLIDICPSTRNGRIYKALDPIPAKL